MAPKRKSTLQASVAPGVLVDAPGFAVALEALARRDPAFMAALDALCERPSLRRRAPGLEGLAWIIVSQQVSTASADAIFARLKAQLGEIVAETLIVTSDAQLRACGLSGPKMRTLRALAAAVADKTLDLDALAGLPVEAAHAALCAIKGIGPWTADIFLLFCLGHADAWPAGDLALQEAARMMLGLAARPSAPELARLAERWRPLRGVAAHCLWAYYRAARLRPATLDATPAPTSRTKTPRKTTPRKTTPRMTKGKP